MVDEVMVSVVITCWVLCMVVFCIYMNEKVVEKCIGYLLVLLLLGDDIINAFASFLVCTECLFYVDCSYKCNLSIPFLFWLLSLVSKHQGLLCYH